MGWSYDVVRCGNVNSETGEFISDLKAALMTQQELAQYAYEQQQAQMGNLGLGGIGSLLNGIGNCITSNVAISTGGTAGTYTISNAYLYEGGELSAPAVAAPPVKSDEFSWLRKRVDDVCWKQAA